MYFIMCLMIDDNCVKIAQLGGLEIILQFVQRYPNVPDLQYQACGVFRNIIYLGIWLIG